VSIPSNQRDRFIQLEMNALPLSESGTLLTDIYVELPHNDRFIRYLCYGDQLLPKHLEIVARHTSPLFFALISDMAEAQSARRPVEISESQKSNSASSKSFEGKKLTQDREAFHTPELEEVFSLQLQFGKENAEFLKKPIAQELKRIFKELVEPNPGQFSIEETPIAELSQKLLLIIAPEIENFHRHLKKMPQYLSVMDSCAALTAISTLFAVAIGQTSRNVFKDLSYACLFMDLALVDFTREDWKTYYLDTDSLPASQKTKVLEHPKRSFDMVSKKFRNLPELVGQMILGHHELFNGKGYPRGIRSETLAPLVRVLSLAVDVFEFMKKAHLEKDPVRLNDALNYFLNEPVEPHSRRHSLPLCREVLEFLQKE
jgi:response regulator RpfG family c-di-GMP phosphodiesterase